MNRTGETHGDSFAKANLDMDTKGPSYMRQREYIDTLVGRSKDGPRLPGEIDPL